MAFPPSGPLPTSEEPQRPLEASASAVPIPTPVIIASAEDGSSIEAWAPEPPPSQAMRRVRRLGWEMIQTLILAALIFLAVRAMAQNFRVEGSSMEPGLHDGEYLLVNKAIYFKVNFETLAKYLPFVHAGDNPQRFVFRTPQRGDVIVFRYPRDPRRDFIKRVIGVPGDKVEMTDGVVSVNGVKVDENYVLEKLPAAYQGQAVPPHSYFVLGDNRDNSSDSRNWGFVPEENIIGQAVFSYWPLDSLGGVGNHRIDLGFIKIPLP